LVDLKEFEHKQEDLAQQHSSLTEAKASLKLASEALQKQQHEHEHQVKHDNELNDERRRKIEEEESNFSNLQRQFALQKEQFSKQV